MIISLNGKTVYNGISLGMLDYIAALLERYLSSFFCEMLTEHCQEDMYPEQEEPVNSDGWLLHNQRAQSFPAMYIYHFAKTKNSK